MNNTASKNINLGFIKELDKRVESYMNSSQSIQGHIILYLKSFFFLGIYALLYYMVVFGDYSPLQRLGWTVLVGFTQVFIVINIAHEGMHGTFYGPKWMSKMMAFSMNFVGGNAYIFKSIHYARHNDLELIISGGNLDQQSLVMNLKGGNDYPIIVFLKKFIVPAMYLFYSFYLVFIRDFELMYGNKLKERGISSHPWYEHFILWFFKVLYIAFFLLVPFMVLDLPTWQIVFGFFMIYLSISVLMIVVLLMPEGVKNPPIKAKNESDRNFLSRIVLASEVDYAANNYLLNFFFGGTNINVAHKLYPHIAHTHYIGLSRIIADTCKEFNYPYASGSILQALKLHMDFVGDLGKGDEEELGESEQTSVSNI